MICKKCGKTIPDNDKFCGHCGKEINDTHDNTSSFMATTSGNNVKFYSKDWKRIVKSFNVSSLMLNTYSYFDIMIDENYLYLIKLPKYHSAVGLTLDFMLGSLGAWIASRVSLEEAEKREHYRLMWIDSNHILISNAYDKDLFSKIFLKELKDNLIFKKNKLVLTCDNQKIILGNNKKEYEQFSKFVENYIL